MLASTSDITEELSTSASVSVQQQEPSLSPTPPPQVDVDTSKLVDQPDSNNGTELPEETGLTDQGMPSFQQKSNQFVYDNGSLDVNSFNMDVKPSVQAGYRPGQAPNVITANGVAGAQMYRATGLSPNMYSPTQTVGVAFPQMNGLGVVAPVHGYPTTAVTGFGTWGAPSTMNAWPTGQVVQGAPLLYAPQMRKAEAGSLQMSSVRGVPDIFQEEHTKLRAQKAFASPEWSVHFIDFERLKAHMDTLTVTKEPASKDFMKACELFWCILKADIDTVNSFYSQKESEYLKRFQEFKFDTFTHSEQMDDKLVLCYFVRLLHDMLPKQYYTHSRTNTLSECCQKVDKNNPEDPELISNFRKFFDLCSELETLRKYVVLNYLTIHRVLAQFDKITGKNSLDAYIPDLIVETFYSNVTLSQLIIRTECVTASLQAQHSMKPPYRMNYICQICQELLVDPVVLSCAHRFCQNCLGVVHEERVVQIDGDDSRSWTRCPTCKKQQNLDPNDHHVDGVLKHFLKSHFGEPKAPRHPKPKRRKIQRKAPVLDIAYANCALPAYATGLAFNPIPTRQMHPDVTGMGVLGLSQITPKPSRGKVMFNSWQNNLLRMSKPFSKSPKRFKQRAQRRSKKQQFQHSVQSSLAQTASSKAEHFAYSQADMKPASCHQCKSNKLPINLLFCSSGTKKKGQRSCHKKFCDLCLQRYASVAHVVQKMTEQRQFKAGTKEMFMWQCPACQKICSCAGCKRKIAKDQQEASGPSSQHSSTQSSSSSAPATSEIIPESSTTPSQSFEDQESTQISTVTGVEVPEIDTDENIDIDQSHLENVGFETEDSQRSSEAVIGDIESENTQSLQPIMAMEPSGQDAEIQLDDYPMLPEQLIGDSAAPLPLSEDTTTTEGVANELNLGFENTRDEGGLTRPEIDAPSDQLDEPLGDAMESSAM